jgi:hypothetical protein
VDFGVLAARAVAEAQIWAQTAVPGDAVDAVDPRDALSPGAWVLTCATLTPPAVRRVVPTTDPPRGVFLLDLDAPLAPGVAYQIGLAALTRSLNGEPTSTAAVELLGRTPVAHTGSVPGQPAADLALPVVVQGGQPAGVDRMEALKARVQLLAQARRGAFTHAPSFGRGVEPKRTYSPAKLAQEAAALRAEIEADPDVRQAEVRVVKDGHLSKFELYVEPSFGAAPLLLRETITAGGET